MTNEDITIEQKSWFLFGKDIQLGDLWNIMDDFNFSHIDEAIEHCFNRLKLGKSIWTKEQSCK